MSAIQPVNGVVTTDRERKLPVGSDRFLATSLIVILGLALFVVISFIAVIVGNALPAFQHESGIIFFSDNWDFGVGTDYGALGIILGTVVTAVGALVVAIPLGIAAALSLVYIVPQRYRLIAGATVELLAAVPSVIYGTWGLLVVAHWLDFTGEPTAARWFHHSWPFNGRPDGVGIWAGMIVLTIMVLPIITAISRDVIAALPRELTEGALALGATRAQVIRQVVLPTAKTGLLGGVVLALGRALGETIALAMLLGGVSSISPLPIRLFATGSTLAAEIANDFLNSFGMDEHVLFALGTILLIIVGSIAIVARQIVQRAQARYR